MSDKKASPNAGDGSAAQRRRTPQRAPRTDVDVPEGYLAVGKIVAVHGLRGELKVELYTDFPERFEAGVVLWASRGGNADLNEITIKSARPHKNMLLLSLEEVRTREDAEAMRGYWLFVDEDEAVELDEDTFFVHDILGLAVQTEEGVVLGKIADVLFTGANEVYVVQGKDLPQGELLLPAIDEVIRAVDLEAGVMTVRLMAGMLDTDESAGEADAA